MNPPVCPYCNEEQDRNFSVEDKKYQKPNNNDFNVCFTCGEIAMFCDDGNSLRKIIDTDKEYIDKNIIVFKKVMNISAKIKTDRAMDSLKVFNKSFKRNIN